MNFKDLFKKIGGDLCINPIEYARAFLRIISWVLRLLLFRYLPNDSVQKNTRKERDRKLRHSPQDKSTKQKTNQSLCQKSQRETGSETFTASANAQTHQYNRQLDCYFNQNETSDDDRKRRETDFVHSVRGKIRYVQVSKFHLPYTVANDDRVHS